MPEHCKSTKLGRKIASSLGEVQVYEIYQNIKDQTRFIKATITIDVNRPLMKGTNIRSKENELIWVDFKYERLPNFCYYCGLIGHDEHNSKKALKDEEVGSINPRIWEPG